MKQFAVILILFFGCNGLYADNSNKEFEKILLQSYDSIRNHVIKTACEIGGVKDFAVLKEISDGRVDSAIAHRQIDSSMVLLIKQNNIKLSGGDYKRYDRVVRTIRANFMGHLLIQDYKREDKVFQGFDIHKKGLDSLFNEFLSYSAALRSDSALSVFIQKYPNSKLMKLIPSEKLKQANEKNNNILVAIIAVIVFAAILGMIYFALELRKSRKSLEAMQNQIYGQSQPPAPYADGDTLDKSSSEMIPPVPSVPKQESQRMSQTDKSEDVAITSSDSLDMSRVNAFAVDNDGWNVVGASVIGNSHISMRLPCQDNNKYVYIKDGWGIAITSDGAGSAEHSDIGSRIVVERGIHYFKSVLDQKKWVEKGILPTEAEWTSIAYITLKTIRDDLEKFAATKNLEYKSLSATMIVVIHSPFGFLITHVGDGRAGYKDETGEWKALITPHKGEEANQTLFMTSEFWNLPYYVKSGVMVPESRVVSCHPVAFTLMSDGCEHTAWQCNMKNEETGIYYDPNKPFERFFNPIIQDISNNNASSDLKTKWANFIHAGNDSFRNEPDDKTMIIGLKML